MVRRELEEAEKVNNRNNLSRVSRYKTVDETSSELVERWRHANQSTIKISDSASKHNQKSQNSTIINALILRLQRT
jgi:hypothetical protein